MSFEKATKGWLQCLGILAETTEALEFLVSEISNLEDLKPDSEKAERFYKACNALRLAQSYCKAQATQIEISAR